MQHHIHSDWEVVGGEDAAVRQAKGVREAVWGVLDHPSLDVPSMRLADVDVIEGMAQPVAALVQVVVAARGRPSLGIG